MAVQILTTEDVRRIHSALVEEFAESGNPIYPPGVKSEDLLASAVFRQSTSLAGVLKYPNVYSNAASLTFGLCCDHPFHNGNKRTALVSLLVHLYNSRLVLEDVGENELYRQIILISTHSVCKNASKSNHYPDRPGSDDEVAEIAAWIQKHSRVVMKGEHQITYRELRHILEHFGYKLGSPKGNAIDVSRRQETTTLFFRKEYIWIHIGSIPYPGDKVIVSVNDMKHVRRLCNLTAEDGFDSETFYAMGDPIDAFIVRYRNILQRLANK